MEKQARNLQLFVDLSQIKKKQKSIQELMIFFNVMNKEIQSCINLGELNMLLHPISRRYKQKSNKLIHQNITNGNFQVNLLQHSSNFKIEHFNQIQRFIKLIRINNGSILSYTTFNLNILNSLIHMQADGEKQFHTELASLDFTTPMSIYEEHNKSYEKIMIKLLDFSYGYLQTCEYPFPYYNCEAINYYTSSQELPLFQINNFITNFHDNDIISKNPDLKRYNYLAVH